MAVEKFRKRAGASTSSRRPRDRPLPARRSWRRGSSAFRYLVVYVTPPGSHETPPSDPSAGRLAGGSRCHRRWPAEPPSHRNSESLAAQRVVVTTPTLRRSGFAIIRLHRGSSGPRQSHLRIGIAFPTDRRGSTRGRANYRTISTRYLGFQEKRQQKNLATPRSGTTREH